jgi:hypothetical protein
MPMVCIVCKGLVTLTDPDLEYIFIQADRLGMESLTEAEQHVVEGRVCSGLCLAMLI